MSTLSHSDPLADDRDVYLLGHAAFDFIEATYGKARVRQFLSELRRDVVDGTGDLYQATFNLTPAEFDASFVQYMRQRFAATR